MNLRNLAVFACSFALCAASSAAAYTLKRTPSGQAIRWGVDRVTVEVHRSFAERVGSEESLAGAAMAADAWRGLGGPDLVLSRSIARGAYRPLERGTQIVVPESWEHAPQLLMVTATSYSESTGRIVDADILVNPAHDFALLGEGAEGSSEERRYDVGAVLTHEMGHVLGLGESDADPLATMWPRIGRGDVHQRSVELDDEEGIDAQYASSTLLAPASGCGGARIAMGRAPRAAWWMIVAAVMTGVLYLAWRRRNERGVALRGTGRSPAAPAAGFAFAGAVVALLAPAWATHAELDAPDSVRAARAFAANRRPAPERQAVLDAALRDASPSVRRAALLGALADPHHEDAGRVARAIDDADPRVARLAREAWQRSMRSAPTVSAWSEEAFAPFEAGAHVAVVRAARAERDDDGNVSTVLEMGDGQLRIPGGCDGGVCTRYGETPLPQPGDTLIVADLHAWAYLDGDVAFGGWLGEAVAVRVDER
ncbi:MAG: matrixin family metalloprotease [Sandaracinaceae bacterium]